MAKAKTTSALTLSAKTVEPTGGSHVAGIAAKVRVKGHLGGAYPTGTVTVTVHADGKKVARTVRLASPDKGVVSVTVAVPGKKGAARYSATDTGKYAGDGNYSTSTTASNKITVSSTKAAGSKSHGSSTKHAASTKMKGSSDKK